MIRRIEVVPYDPRWPDLFAAEAVALHRVFGTALRAIHHVGSTAVPGLPAKPTIDILIVLDDTEGVERFDPAMEALGYRVRGECLDAGGTPGRFYYSKPTEGKRTHHVHLCTAGHFQIPEMILFPEYLRRHPEIAAEYGRLKLRAVEEGADRSVPYMERKHEWIRSAIRDALEYFSSHPPRSPP